MKVSLPTLVMKVSLKDTKDKKDKKPPPSKGTRDNTEDTKDNKEDTKDNTPDMPRTKLRLTKDSKEDTKVTFFKGTDITKALDMAVTTK